jgi:golgin subfamily A member 4
MIKHRLSRIEKAIDHKHTSLTPFDLQIEHVKNNMKKEQHILEKHKQKESNFYQNYADKNQMIYDSLLDVCSRFALSHINFIKNLDQTVYVTDSLLYLEEKKLNKDHHFFGQHIVKHQQALLNHIFEFYEANDQKQEEIVKDFNKAQSHLARELAANKASVLNDLKKQQESLGIHKEKEIKTHIETHKNELKVKDINDKKELLVISNQIKTLEKDLESHLSRMKQELNLINDNQIQIASQSLQEYEKQHMILNQNNYKQVSKFDQQLENEEKSFQTLDTSISNKNQALLQRFEQNRVKQIALFEDKTTQFKENIEKSRETNQKHMKVYDQDVSLMQETRAYEIRNMKEHTKRYRIKSEKAQQKVYKTELKALKANYRFKLRALKLK